MTIGTRPFDPAAYLDSPEALLAYLNGAFADGDAGEIADSLGVVARARAISQLAEETGLPWQALYKALSLDGAPSRQTPRHAPCPAFRNDTAARSGGVVRCMETMAMDGHQSHQKCHQSSAMRSAASALSVPTP